MTQEIELNVERRADKLVEQEIHVCMSALVCELQQKMPDEFIDQFSELSGKYIQNDEGEEEYIEAYEYWAVSSWFAHKLEEQGEIIEKDFYGLYVWGRTTTGQAISMDYVIRKIIEDIE